MKETLQAAITAIQMRFNAQAQEFRGDCTITLNAAQLLDAARTLRDEFQFNMLMDVTAVDYWPQQQPRFHLIYQLFSMSQQTRLMLRVPLDGNAPEMDTAEGVFPNANWKEREIFDLFGIRFKGHSDLRRIMMPPDWQGHPLRKDYPLGYEEVQFSFNYDEINLRKPHSKGLR